MSDDLVTWLRAQLDELETAAGLALGSPGEGREWALRMLPEVEAKRRILDRHADCGSGSGYCDDGGHGWDYQPGGGCADLADLALPYAGRSGYRAEWRP